MTMSGAGLTVQLSPIIIGFMRKWQKAAATPAVLRAGQLPGGGLLDRGQSSGATTTFSPVSSGLISIWQDRREFGS
jgi:hypothetical protein